MSIDTRISTRTSIGTIADQSPRDDPQFAPRDFTFGTLSLHEVWLLPGESFDPRFKGKLAAVLPCPMGIRRGTVLLGPSPAWLEECESFNRRIDEDGRGILESLKWPTDGHHWDDYEQVSLSRFGTIQEVV